MKDWIKIREILKNIQNRQNKNQAIYLVGMVDLNELDISWLIDEDYIEIDDAISYLDNRDIVFIKDLTFKGKKLLYQLSI
ncbi:MULTISPECIES: hypothetical protein [Acinetobacter]|jgi:hypothetical protein|nr:MULTISPECIES: hypothetical protein [Acinetobacter]KQW88214.1 hypothetical protein ASC84_12625 [Acinetobacter sp. Root1280]ENU56955.1 hypothetical protein F981_04090 [Acinetobacter guillouiae CIP 63.46]EPH32747.1 hypothetical protein L291_3124 [Acinetobacter guillouiae MSP4-18]KAB0624007.1 hypothetical protein F7P82_19450 [Acinetobacter guillouiae]KEC85472.1 hypothetical protein DT74_20770 [Acinetobacter sp. ETR1]